MKRQFGKTLQHIAALTLGVLLTLGPAAQAANNQGTGDIAGVPSALANSNLFELLSSGTLALVKTAFLTSGGLALTTGATLLKGTEVDFMIYLNNKSDIAVLDVSIQDALNALFVYKAGTIYIDNAVNECAATDCTLAEEKAIYDAAILTVLKTDPVDPDTVSFAGTTIDVGDSVIVGNAKQDAAANKVLAVVFTVTVQ
jgi:hypothetical protein